jgi:hypothetical protein
MRLCRVVPIVAAALAAAPAVAANAPLSAGFPATVAGSGIPLFSRPLVVDLDNNGTGKEIVVGTDTGRLVILDSNGSVRANVQVTTAAGLPTNHIASSPAAGQLDGDQQLEIVVGFGFTGANDRGGVRAFDHNGNTLWTFTTFDRDTNGNPDPVVGTPALGDLDGDGLDDVVFGSWDFFVYAVKGTTGVALPGWPAEPFGPNMSGVRDTVWSSAALFDLDGNGNLEVIIGADTHLEGSPINTPEGGALWVFRSNGTTFPGFPQFAPKGSDPVAVGIQSSPVVGDIDGDSCPEIVVGTGLPNPFTAVAGRKLYAWNTDGSPVAGFPVDLSSLGNVAGSPALANLDVDAALEIVVAVNKSDGGAEGRVAAYNGNGTQVFAPLRPRSVQGGLAVSVTEIAVAGSGTGAVIAVGGVGFDVTLISAAGAQLSDDGIGGAGPGLVYSTGHPVPGPAIAAVDVVDGDFELIAASSPSADNATDLWVYVWNPDPSPLPAVATWPQFRNNPRRRGAIPELGGGCAAPNPPLVFFTLTPCRVSDSRNSGNSTYGGPIFSGGEERTITFHSASTCPSIPATAKAVSINLTVTGPNIGGFLQVYPAGSGIPPTSSLNFGAGQTRANNAVVPLSFDGLGRLTVRAGMAPGGVVHVVLDINGYFQ